MQITNPYLRLMRLHQPVGIWLLLWPCWWSLALAQETRPLIYILFALGAVVMRAAGCIINDIWDRDFDRQVERTKTRPLASGELSLSQAIVLLVGLLVIGLAIANYLGKAVIIWATISLILVVTYPLMKRITWWPQLFLGFTFNWGALLGWVAVKGQVDLPALYLYLACVFWTLGYDTIYAHQDKEDDVKIGVKSAALKLGKYTKPFVFFCYVIFFTTLFLIIQPKQWGLFFMVCTGLHLVWQVFTVNLGLASSCKKTFCSNNILGWLPFWAMLSNI